MTRQDESIGVGPSAQAARRGVGAGWTALMAAGLLALALHADAAPGWMLDMGAPVRAYEAATGFAKALSPLAAPRDALGEWAGSLRP